MNNRVAALPLMTHWMQEWQTLGRWQALNARLSRDASPENFGWARRSLSSCRSPDARVAVSAQDGRAVRP
jgi:hypothetical protein